MSSDTRKIYDVPLHVADNSEWDDVRAPISDSTDIRAENDMRERPRAVKKKKQETWLAKRGHALSYMGLFLFSIIVYFRPYEFHPSLEVLSSLAFWLAVLTLAVFLPTQLSLEGNLTARPREVNCVLLLTLAALLSIPLAIDPARAYESFLDPFAKVVVMFIVMVNVMRTEWRLKGMIYLAFTVSFVLALAALRDNLAGRATVEGYRVAGSIGGMFGNPNDMALHLVTMIALVAAFAIGSRGIVKKALYILFGCLLVAGTVVTYSRGGFLGMMASLMFLTWKFTRRWRFIVMPLFAAAAIVFVLLSGTYADRLSTILTPGSENSASSRRDLLYRSIKTALYNPLFGVGMNNFNIVSIHEQVSHNAYTQVAADLGLPAFCFYLAMIATAFNGLRRVERETVTKSDKTKFYYWAIGLQASLIAYAVGSFFASVAYQWYVYYLISYAISVRRIHHAEAGMTRLKTRRNDRHARGDDEADDESEDKNRVSLSPDTGLDKATATRI